MTCLSYRDFGSRVDRLRGQRDQTQRNLDQVKRDLGGVTANLKIHESAREVIREVGIRTQSQLSCHISDITTLALSSIFFDAYELTVDFVQRKTRTECDLMFKRGDLKVDPLTASGGGAVDVASFALRVASWSMQTPRPRSVLLLDEPFKHLSAELLPSAANAIKEISEKLGLQIIYITHSDIFGDAADVVHEIKMRKGISRVVTKR